jgi:hypothetical protein
MIKNSTGSAISNSLKIEDSKLPLDIQLIPETPFLEEKKESDYKYVDPIIVESINYEGNARKVPYSPISTLFIIDFK